MISAYCDHLETFELPRFALRADSHHSCKWQQP